MNGSEARTVWVGNLDPRVSEEILFELFMQAGPLLRVTIPKNHESKQQRTFGFVEFMHEVSVDYAIKLLKGIRLFKRELKINPTDRNRSTVKQPPQNQLPENGSYHTRIPNLHNSNLPLYPSLPFIMPQQQNAVQNILDMNVVLPYNISHRQYPINNESFSMNNAFQRGSTDSNQPIYPSPSRGVGSNFSHSGMSSSTPVSPFSRMRDRQRSRSPINRHHHDPSSFKCNNYNTQQPHDDERGGRGNGMKFNRSMTNYDFNRNRNYHSSFESSRRGGRGSSSHPSPYDQRSLRK